MATQTQELSASEYWDFVNEIDALKATINRLHKEKQHLNNRCDALISEVVLLRTQQSDDNMGNEV